MKDKKLNATLLRVYEYDYFGELLGVMYWKRFYNSKVHFWTETYDGRNAAARVEGPCEIYQDGSQVFNKCEQ